jgi:hypothetical protein
LVKKDAYAYAHKNGCNIRNNKRFFCITWRIKYQMAKKQQLIKDIKNNPE